MKLGWYSDLTPVERRTYWACFGGFGLDSMDTTMYALVIPSLIAVLGISRPEAGYLATAALVGAAAGGWGAGLLADRIGRVRVLQLTILWVAALPSPPRSPAGSTRCSACASSRALATAAKRPWVAC